MAQVKPDTTIRQYQDFVKEVYGLPNDRYFSAWDMITNVERFATRGLKGIRKGDKERTKTNLLIALSWFTSLMNQLHIDIEEEVWKRFPYMCSYCASCPCSCKETRPEARQQVSWDEEKRPKTMKDFQEMFAKIYPAQARSLEHAGVHLAEEMGEFSESFLNYRGRHNDEDFENVVLEAADLFSCIMGVFNSLDINVAEELSLMFGENCHACKKAPCECNFVDVANFKS
jgi:NTP pyrophosphatase (non-canonical NTP hydrolase)